MNKVDRAPGSILRIDTLRGIAILLVIGFHFLADVYGYFGIWTAPAGLWWLFSPLSLGWTGVSLFFVISGYVIHRSFLLSKSFTWSDYAARRAWRIYPPYIAALMFFIIVKGGVPIFSEDFLLHVFLLHNLSRFSFYEINPSFWSLAVEVQLYALFPIALWVRRRWGAQVMFASSCGVAMVSLLVTGAVVGLPLEPWGTHTSEAVYTNWNAWMSPFSVWPSWLIGALLAENHLEGRRTFSRPLLWCAGMAFLTVAFSAFRPTYPLVFCASAFAWAAIVDTYLRRPAVTSATERCLSWIGIWSYSIYLLHQPFIPAARRFLSRIGLEGEVSQMTVGLMLFSAATMLLGWTFYRTVERGSIAAGNSFRARPRFSS